MGIFVISLKAIKRFDFKVQSPHELLMNIVFLKIAQPAPRSDVRFLRLVYLSEYLSVQINKETSQINSKIQIQIRQIRYQWTSSS